MKTLLRFLLVSFLPCFLFCGCGKPDLSKEIIGQWDCTDFRWNETRARNDAAKFTMVFTEDSTCLSFWTDTGGSRYMEFTNKYCLLGEQVRLEDENVVFRARLEGDVMTLVRENSTINPKDHGKPDDAGKEIIFHRQRVSPSVPHKP